MNRAQRLHEIETARAEGREPRVDAVEDKKPTAMGLEELWAQVSAGMDYLKREVDGLRTTVYNLEKIVGGLVTPAPAKPEGT